MTDTGFQTVKLSEIEAWPGLNPRLGFDEAQLQELADSIRVDGLLQPVAVAPAGLRKKGVRFWLFAGERRLRACQILAAHRKRLKVAAPQTIDVIVHDVDEATAHRLAGVENLDRDDLTAVEEAIWLERELALTGGSQKELGEALGRSQAWVANRIRLMALPEALRTLIHEGVVAPAMVRDTLLRFLKLDEDVQPKLWKAIVREIKRAAKDTSPVPLQALRGATSLALRSSGAKEIREGHQYDTNSNRSFQVTPARFAEFKEEHAGRCVQADSYSYGYSEEFWTFAVSEWLELVGEELEKVRSTLTTGGVSKKKLQKPKLGPTKEPVGIQELRNQYGHDNVILFDRIVDPSKIEPTNVAPVKVAGHQSSSGKASVELAYVGPNVRALKGARTRCATPIRAEVATAVQAARMDKAADLALGEIFTGLLNAISETNWSSTVKGMIEAELGREVKFDRYAFGKDQIGPLKIPAKSLRRIAAGLARIATSDVQYWDLEGEIEKAVEKRVTKDTAKARKAWVDEHAPKGA